MDRMQHHDHPCASVSRAVRRCHSLNGIQGEDCVREELSEKKCYAELLCRPEAKKFYYEPFRRGRSVSSSTAGAATCSALVEVFAFPENEMSIPEDVSREERKSCRQVVHDLATCLARRRGTAGSAVSSGYR